MRDAEEKQSPIAGVAGTVNVRRSVWISARAAGWPLAKTRIGLVGIVFVFFLVTGSVTSVSGQGNPARVRLPVQAVERIEVANLQEDDIPLDRPADAGVVPDSVADTTPDGGDEGKFPHGAILQTNPDIEGVLEKANRYMEEGNYRAASRFWQAAIKRAGDQLYSADGEMYFPLVRKIEEIIATLPQVGLETYRIAADAEAAEYLAEGLGENDVTSLQKVVDLAFLSTQGDQAALRLAAVHLDRFEAVPAEMLLKRIVEVYPDPDVPMDEVWLRLAVTHSIMGNQTQAEAALEKAKSLRSEVSESLIEQVQAMTASTSLLNPAQSTNSQWSSVLGLGSGVEQMPALPAGYLDQSLVPVWMFQHDFMKQPKGKYIDGEVFVGTEKVMAAELASSTQRREFEEVNKQWSRDKWRSVSMPLIVDQKVVFKTQGDLAAWSTQADATGTLNEKAVLRSLNLNRYFPDDVSKFILEQSDQNRNNFPAAGNVPFPSIETMQYFGDPLFQSMSVHNGVVYSVEGIAFGRDVTFRDRGRRNPVNVWSSPPIRNRSTFLSAYELATGRTLWNEPFPNKSHGNDLADAGVVGPAVGYNNSILVPVLASGRFLVVSLNARSGELQWRRTICDMPQLQAASTTLVQLALTGSDLFMVCGSGVLANLDAGSGQLRWIRRYQRSIEETVAADPNQQFFGRANQDWQRYSIHGWSHDAAIAWGPWVIVAASDLDYLAGFRRSDGALVWKAPRADVLGCTVDQWLGVYQGIVYAVGPRGLIAYELAAEGRLYGTPQRLAKPISGRGLVTKNGVLLPIDDHLEWFDLKSLVKVRDIDVAMPDNMPIGGLVSDGQRLWAAAMNRLIAFAPETGENTTQRKSSAKKKTADDEAND